MTASKSDKIKLNYEPAKRYTNQNINYSTWERDTKSKKRRVKLRRE